MNTSSVSNNDDICDSGFDNGSYDSAALETQSINSLETKIDNNFDIPSVTADINVNNDDDFSDSLILQDNEVSPLPIDSQQNEIKNSTHSSDTDLISTNVETLSSIENEFSPALCESDSLVRKRNVRKECGEYSLPKPDEKIISPQDSSYELLNGITKVKDTKPIYQSISKKNKIAKIKEIIIALENNDTNSLKKAALSPGGLINDDIRRKAWPKLVGVDLVAATPRPCQEEIEQHPYYQQVLLDVNRSLKRFPPSIHEAQRLTMLDQLVTLIMRVLCMHPELHYYQGYHDICVTFLLVLGEETAYHVVEKLSQTHLRVFMEKSMEPTIHLLEHMYLLIGKRHPSYRDFLLKSEVGVAYCLSWLITWFSHVLNDYNTVVRFFDYFIVSHSWMPMYATASLVLFREIGVMKQDCDMASVHSYLCNIPDDLPFEILLTDALDLFKSYKPKLLAKERPYVSRVDRNKRIKKWSFIQRYRYIPATLVIAAAVLVSAVIYQAYKY